MDFPGTDTSEDFRSSTPTVRGASQLLDTLAETERLPREASAGLEVCKRPPWLLWESQSTEPKLEVGFPLPGGVEEGGMTGRGGQASGWGRAEHWIRLRFSRAGLHLYPQEKRVGGGFAYMAQIPPR